MLKLYFIFILALINGGYMLLDSTHRFIYGDFIRIDGQLGPWANLISNLNIDPISMGPFFFIFGMAQLFFAIGFIRKTKWGTTGTKCMAILSLFYLAIGKALAIIQLTLLYFLSNKKRVQ